jgi:rubrerythrin
VENVENRTKYEGDCPMESHQFSDLEGLRIAIEMERRGVEFYRRAARLAKSDHIVTMLEELAVEEEGHQRDFAKLMEEQCTGRYQEAAVCYAGETSAYLSAVAADVVFPGGLLEVGRRGGFDSLPAILTSAIDSEKNSILFYSELKELTGDAGARAAFGSVISQEKVHLARLQQQLISC